MLVPQPLQGGQLPSTYAFANVESKETKTSLRLRMCLHSPDGAHDEAGELEAPLGGPSAGSRQGDGPGGDRLAKPSKGKGKGEREWAQENLRPGCTARVRGFLASAASSTNSPCWLLKVCPLCTTAPTAPNSPC